MPKPQLAVAREPKLSLRDRIRLEVEQTITAREEISARIKALTAEVAEWNAKLLKVIQSGGDADADGKVRLVTERWKCQIVEYDSERLDKDKLKAYLVDKLDLSPTQVAKAFTVCSRTEHIGPYVRVDPVKSPIEQATDAAERAAKRAARAR